MEVELIAVTQYLRGNGTPEELLEHAGRVCYRSGKRGEGGSFLLIQKRPALSRAEGMTMRQARIQRRTKETEIELSLDLDGQGQHEVDTSIPFLDHMLSHVAVHGLFDLSVKAKGDTEVDDHHTVEDVGIALGQALREALGDKGGLTRYGSQIVPMDEALALVAVDISGRGLLVFEAAFPQARVGRFDTELVAEFLRALAHNAGLTLHVRMLDGRNTHHIIEAIFKGLGRALRQAVEVDDRRAGVPSTKGVL